MRMTVAALRATAAGRGFDPDKAERAITGRHNDVWVEVDTSHPDYPRYGPASKEPPAAVPTPILGGPGTELKALLKVIGITSSPTCSCNARAKTMDSWGADQCEARLPEIVGWLEEESRKRNLPFVRFAAEQVVKLAIRRARRSAAR